MKESKTGCCKMANDIKGGHTDCASSQETDHKLEATVEAEISKAVAGISNES